MNQQIHSLSAAFLLMLSMLFCAVSCKKKDLGPNDPSNGGGSTVRPVGEPVADAWFETIGPAGGIVKSQDGRVEIEIPAGALAEETEISIQPLKNTAVSGIGYSYRFTPHGKIFQKKVTVRFSYKKDERRISSAKGLEIAYQNDKGVWTCAGGTVHDPVQKTISLQTDHFSDWNFIASVELLPVVKTIGLGETVTLKALRYVHPLSDEDFLVPLTIPNAGSGEPMTLEQKYIVKWTLNGPGKLEGKGSEAVYTAPSVTPANKTATITLELNVGGKQVLLISTIHIIDEGIEISIDGGPWHTYPGIATKMPGLNKYALGGLRTSADLPQIVFMWPLTSGQKADGIYGWSMLGEEETQVVFEYADPALEKIYAAMYEDENHDVHDSGGFLSVEETEKNGKKYLSGMFAIDQAGLVESATAKQIGISSIMGTFKVQRSW